MGLLPGSGVDNPGEHSLRLGTPGLYYGRPLAFKAGMGWESCSGWVIGRSSGAEEAFGGA